MNADLSGLMKQAQQMQENIQKTQEELSQMIVVGEAGAGLVKVSMTGRYSVKEINTDPSLDREPSDIRNDLIAAAVNDAVRKVESSSKTKMSGLMSGLNLPQGFNFGG